LVKAAIKFSSSVYLSVRSKQLHISNSHFIFHVQSSGTDISIVTAWNV